MIIYLLIIKSILRLYIYNIIIYIDIENKNINLIWTDQKSCDIKYISHWEKEKDIACISIFYFLYFLFKSKMSGGGKDGTGTEGRSWADPGYRGVFEWNRDVYRNVLWRMQAADTGHEQRKPKPVECLLDVYI